MPENPHPNAPPPRTHVFAVGVASHQTPAFEPLAFAENDALEFTKAWLALGAQPTDCVTLAGTQATKTTVESAFRKFLRGVAANDTVVLFMSGRFVACGPHGTHLVTHDTQPDDIRWTSIPLTAVLAQLQDSTHGRVLLFVDAHACRLPTDPASDSNAGMPASLAGELKHFGEGAANRVAFTACATSETPCSSPTLQRGLWLEAVLHALSGEVKAARVDGHQVTAESLQNHLADEVPRLLRTTRTGPETQTPCRFGPASAGTGAARRFLVADLTPVLGTKAATANALGSALKDASLRGATSGQVRRLRGFRTGHAAPDRHSPAAEAFVRRLGHDEVKEHADAIHEGIRTAFGYRRKDLSYVCHDGSATIKTPDFDVHVAVAQDPDDPGAYRLATEVGSIRRPEVLTGDGFDRLFSRYCDTVVIEFSRRLPLEDTIDAIEEVPGLRAHFHYEPDASSFTLELPAQGIRIRATADRMTFSSPGSRNLRALLEKTQAALSALGGAGVTLGLPGSAPP